jgi:hypothetical protein
MYKFKLFILLFFIASSAAAQVPTTAAGYVFSSTSGIYVPITGGTSVTAIIGDDVNSASLPIGFTFPFAGGTYTTLTANSNGWLSLINGNPTATVARTNTAANGGTIAPLLMPLWDDHNGSPNGQAFYITEGAQPNRIFTFEWRSWRWFYDATGNNVISFQVKLHESGRIDFVYSQGPDAVTTAFGPIGATIGIAKSATDFQTLSTTTASPVSSTTTFYDALTSRPATGQVYTWDKPCAVPTGFASSNVTNNSATVNWNAVTGSAGYEYVISQSSSQPSAPGTAVPTATKTFTGLLGGTTYYVHVRNVCGANSYSAWATTSFNTVGCIRPNSIIITNITDQAASILWNVVAAPYADNYDYAVDFSSSDPYTGITNTSSNYVNLTSLTPNSKYYFHIRSRCLGADSSKWGLDSFVTLMACYAPVVNINLLGTNNPTGYWSPVPTAVSYEYALTSIDYEPSFGSETHQTNVALNLPADGKAYYLFVRTKCNSMFTFSPWTKVQLRESYTSVGSVDAAKEVVIYPNPVGNVLKVKGIAGLDYVIKDVTGRALAEGRAGAGEAAVNTSDLSAGAYFIEINKAGSGIRFRFIKQ